MNGLPAWVQVLQALLTPTIGLAVGWVAYEQWRTARAKLNLDLFAKRYEVYQNAYLALASIMREGKAKDTTAFQKMLEAWRESQFLFGQEMTKHLDKLLSVIMRMEATEREMESSTRSPHLVAVKLDCLKLLATERDALVNWFQPYMLMDERRIGTLSEWVRRRNELRLSYADEKQR